MFLIWDYLFKLLLIILYLHPWRFKMRHYHFVLFHNVILKRTKGYHLFLLHLWGLTHKSPFIRSKNVFTSCKIRKNYCLRFNTFFTNSILYGHGRLKVSELFASFEKQYKYQCVIFTCRIVILVYLFIYLKLF